jgi:hypothetical protein
LDRISPALVLFFFPAPLVAPRSLSRSRALSRPPPPPPKKKKNPNNPNKTPTTKQIPTFGFLYVAGWIGYVGRNYLNAVKSRAKPTDAEIILDVPMALKMAFQGAAWPAQVVEELKRGSLTEKDENITVSPR